MLYVALVPKAEIAAVCRFPQNRKLIPPPTVHSLVSAPCAFIGRSPVISAVPAMRIRFANGVIAVL